MKKYALWITVVAAWCGLVETAMIEKPLTAAEVTPAAPVATAPALQGGPDKVVCGFESAEDWTTENESPRELSSQYVTEGKQSLKVTFLTKPEWPTVITEKVPKDWANYSELKLDVFSPSDEPAKIGMWIMDHAGTKTRDEASLPYGAVKKGWNTLVFPLPKMADALRLDQVRSVCLFNKTGKEVTLYFDNLRLAGFVPPKAFRHDLRVLSDHPRLLFTGAQIPELKARCAGTYKADYEKMKAWADAHLDGNVPNGGPTFGLLYHLTGEEKYARAGLVVLKRCFDGKYSSDDRLFQFEKCIMFDLLYPALSKEEREEYNGKLFDAMLSFWEQAKHRVWQFHSIYNFGPLVLALHGNGYKDAEVAAIFDGLVEQTETRYWPDMEEAARNRGGIKDGLFCRCTESFVVPYFMMWQNATGQKVFETKNLLRNYGTYYIYNLVNVHERDADIKNANTVPLGSIYHGGLGRPGSQGLPIVAAMARDGVSGWIAGQKWWQAARGMDYWSDNPPAKEIYFKIIFKDPALTHVEPKELPETALFEKWGWVAMRSSWDADGVFAHFKCGDYRCGEPANLDNNQFIIYHKGLLAHDGIQDQKPDGAYGQMSLAHNTVTVYDPDEVIMGSEKYTWWLPKKPFAVNDGGQTFQKERMVAPEYGYVLTPSQDLGDITQYQTAPRFDYACGDATKAYNPKKVELFTRQFVFLKPDTFVVFDRVVSSRAEFRKRWHLHSLEEPVIQGDLVSVTRKGGRLWVQTLLPAQPVIRKVQGAQVEKPDGTYEVPEYWKQCPTDIWRVDIGCQEARQADVFLHVLQVVDAGKDMTAKAEASEKEGKVSIKVSAGKAEWEVTFAASGGPAGHVRLVEDGKAVIDQNFANKVVDSYWPWKDDPRFRMWMTDPRFGYTIPEADIERYRKEAQKQ